MSDLVEKLKTGRFRGTTQKNYYSVWKAFNHFIICLDIKPKNWEDRIILYVNCLIQCKKKASTIRSYVSAIRAVLMNDGYKLNEDKFLLNSMTRAGKLINDHVRTRFPIRKPMLASLIRGIKDLFKSQPYLSKLYQAMFATAYYGLFRVSEITKGEHPILAWDVHIGKNKRKLLFLLQSSKTLSKDSRPQTVKISSSPNARKSKTATVLCPYKLVDNFLKIRPDSRSSSEPFFVFRDNSPVKPAQFRKILKSTLKKKGFKQKLYDTHSFRIGRSVDLYEMGVSVESIRKLGRWKSNCVQQFLQ